MVTLYNRWIAWFGNLTKRSYTVAEYPPHLEPLVQEAIQHKRNEEYLESINIYISILERENSVYPDLLKALYKSVLCAGRLDFAYEVIVLAEYFAKTGWGLRPASNNPFLAMLMPKEEWHQAVLRKELEKIVYKYEKYAYETPDSSTVEKIYQDFYNFISPYSGQEYYQLPPIQYCLNTVIPPVMDSIKRAHAAWGHVLDK